MTEKKEKPEEKKTVPTAPHVYQAIADIAGELAKTGIGKDNTNQMQKYKFRGIDDVYNALSGLLAKHRLVILPRVLERSVTERDSKNGGVLFYVVLRVDFDFVSALDGSKHTVTTLGEAMDSGDKATNKAMSAAYKYACLEAFCIPTEGDNDADGTTHEVKPKDPVKEENREPTEQQKWLSDTAKKLKAMKTYEEVIDFQRDALTMAMMKKLSTEQVHWYDEKLKEVATRTMNSPIPKNGNGAHANA